MKTTRILFSFLVAAVLGGMTVATRAQGGAAPGIAKPPAAQKLVLRGKLTRVMGIGGESTGWMLEFAKEMTVDGKKLHSIEISGEPKRLEKFADQTVRVRGTIKHRHTVERGEWIVLFLSSLQPADKPANP